MAGPWIKFYPSDWRADPALRMCSVAARGLWMEMLCVMHEANPRGSLVINGAPLSDRQLASIAGASPKETTSLLAELEAAGVFSRDNGVIYSRRMRRDDEKAERDKANGKAGGNPNLKGGVNPQDKAQKPEARDQKPEKKKDAADAPESGGGPPDADAEYFRRGREIKIAGSVLAQLKKAKNGSVPLARAALEHASTKHNPLEYIMRIVHGHDAEPTSPII